MRGLFLGSLLVAGSLLMACGDDTSGGGGSGGNGGSGDGGSPDTGGSPATGGMGGTPTNGGGGEGGGTGGGSGECTAVDGATDWSNSSNFFYGLADPPLGGDLEDDVEFIIPNGTTGTVTNFAIPANVNDCLTTPCAFIEEDYDFETGTAARQWAATSGTLELGATAAPYYIAGTFSNAEYVEVIIDWADTLDVTVVDGGSCATFNTTSFDFGDPPVPGWTCAFDYYDADDGCDCECGVQDLDCDGTQEVIGCTDDAAVCVDGTCNPPNP